MLYPPDELRDSLLLEAADLQTKIDAWLAQEYAKVFDFVELEQKFTHLGRDYTVSAFVAMQGGYFAWCVCPTCTSYFPPEILKEILQ
jgi:hypothetical protein